MANKTRYSKKLSKTAVKKTKNLGMAIAEHFDDLRTEMRQAEAARNGTAYFALLAGMQGLAAIASSYRRVQAAMETDEVEL